MKEIKICNLVTNCPQCPFYAECGLDFGKKKSKEMWKETIESRIEELQNILKKIEKTC